MRIALVAPPWAPIPPVSYGGIESVVHNLAVGLHRAGHEVVLVCTGDSTCPVPRRSTLPRAEASRLGMAVPEMVHVTAAYAELGRCDVVHDHTVVGPFYAPGRVAGPIVTTAHGPIDGELGQLYQRMADSTHLIAISEAQARSARDVPVAKVIHHGVDTTVFPFGSGDGGYYVFLGRMSPEKGADRAIEAARLAGVSLVLAAKCREPAEHEYFEQFVAPTLGDGVVYVGEVSMDRKLELLASARALLFPIRWPEPFGMVMIEALACGTPVVAFGEGSVPEIVADGTTGYICADEQEMAEAIGNVGRIDRRACRDSVEKRFSVERMVDDHVNLFQALAGGDGAPS